MAKQGVQLDILNKIQKVIPALTFQNISGELKHKRQRIVYVQLKSCFKERLSLDDQRTKIRALIEVLNKVQDPILKITQDFSEEEIQKIISFLPEILPLCPHIKTFDLLEVNLKECAVMTKHSIFEGSNVTQFNFRTRDEENLKNLEASFKHKKLKRVLCYSGQNPNIDVLLVQFLVGTGVLELHIESITHMTDKQFEEFLGLAEKTRLIRLTEYFRGAHQYSEQYKLKSKRLEAVLEPHHKQPNLYDDLGLYLLNKEDLNQFNGFLQFLFEQKELEPLLTCLARNTSPCSGCEGCEGCAGWAPPDDDDVAKCVSEILTWIQKEAEKEVVLTASKRKVVVNAFPASCSSAAAPEPLDATHPAKRQRK